MYRKSSKGNPYHDAKGRFTSADGRLVPRKTGIEEDAPIEMWSSFGERHDADSVLSKDKDGNLIRSKETWEKLDRETTSSYFGKRHYHKQSISREKNAKALSQVSVPKGLSSAQRKRYIALSLKEFEKENKYARKNGAKIVAYRKGNSNEIRYQIVESERMRDDVLSETNRNKTRKYAKVTRNTSTTMKQFSGYTVEFTKNNLVRSCAKNASPDDIEKHLAKFCSKHKSELSGAETCIKIWTDGSGRVRYSATFHFDDDNREAAEALAKKMGGVVVNHDDGSQW